jgi:drug/metabolite transporter (DMT)-like permease
MQFILVTIAAYPSQRGLSGQLLKQTKVPVGRWAVAAVMFFTINMLNNWAFAFNISVPVHIILRSFGSVCTMGAGWLTGKTYSRLQVISVLVLTAGVVISAWADALSKVHPSHPSKDKEC